MKAHEGEPVADQVFDVFIRKVVQCLQHQDLEHHDRIEGLATGVAFPLFGGESHHSLDLATKTLEGNDQVERLERIALGADRLKTFVEIVEPKLPPRFPPLGQSGNIRI